MTTILHTGRFLELVEDGHWEFVRRLNASAVVGIVAVTPAGELLLVEQQRIPIGTAVIELPAGLVGDEGADDTVLTAAARELEEETGWRAGQVHTLARGPSSAGLANEIVTLVRAKNLSRIGPGGGVAGESIIVHHIPLAGISVWLSAGAAAGKLIDHKVHAGLWWLSQEDSGRRS
jgi:ADP-ribose pyrophosphatase